MEPTFRNRSFQDNEGLRNSRFNFTRNIVVAALGTVAAVAGFLGGSYYKDLKAAQAEITGFVKGTPSQGHYICTNTSGGGLFKITASDYLSGQTNVPVVYLTGPMRTKIIAPSCEAHLGAIPSDAGSPRRVLVQLTK